MKDDLCPTLIAIIEVLVGRRCFAKWQFVKDDERGIRFTVMDKITQPAVVGLYVRLPGAHLLPLEPELAESNAICPFFSRASSAFGSWGLLLDLGIGDRVNTNFLRSVINECFHKRPSGWCEAGFLDVPVFRTNMAIQ
jgi:hypothetical protein